MPNRKNNSGKQTKKSSSGGQKTVKEKSSSGTSSPIFNSISSSPTFGLNSMNLGQGLNNNGSAFTPIGNSSPNYYYGWQPGSPTFNNGQFQQNAVFNRRLEDMYNFMIQNNYMSAEISKLNKENSMLRDQIKRLEDDIKDYRSRCHKIMQSNNILTQKLNWLSNQDQITIKSKKIVQLIDSEKKKRPKTYKYLSKADVDKELKIKFENMKSIKDIIKFKEDKNRFSFFNNNKYKKLFNLIPSLESLDKIIGMKSVKEQVFKKISYFIHGLNKTDELNHIIITGDPGVGKTTLATILGKIYLSLGFLKNNKIVKAKRDDLIGQYCGTTAKKTRQVMESAAGGVLILDELYALGNKEQKDSFTSECIDEINRGLTEINLLCIGMGYKKDLNERFFKYNEGLESRFPNRFDIASNTSDELYDIFMKFASETNWSLEEETKEELKSLITQNRSALKYCGRDINHIFKLSKEHFSTRLMNTALTMNQPTKVLEKVDLEYGFKEFTKDKKINEVSEHVKSMYS